MKKRLGALVLPADGVKIPNSSIVNVEGEEQAVSFFVRFGRAEETAERNMTTKAVANMIASAEQRLK